MLTVICVVLLAMLMVVGIIYGMPPLAWAFRKCFGWASPLWEWFDGKTQAWYDWWDHD